MATSTKGKSGSFTNFVSSVVQTVKNAFTPESQKATYDLGTKDSSGTYSGGTATSGISNKPTTTKGGGGGGSSGGTSYIDTSTGKGYEISPEGVKTEITPAKKTSKELAKDFYELQRSNKEKKIPVNVMKIEESYNGVKQGEKFYIGTKENSYQKEVARTGYGMQENKFVSNLTPGQKILARFSGGDNIEITPKTFKKQTSSLPQNEQNNTKDTFDFRDITKYSDPVSLDMGNNNRRSNRIFDILDANRIRNLNLSRNRINNNNLNNTRTDKTIFEKIQELNLIGLNTFQGFSIKDILDFEKGAYNFLKEKEIEGKLPQLYVNVPDKKDIGFQPTFTLIPDENDISFNDLNKILKEHNENISINKRNAIAIELQNLEKGNVGTDNTWTGSEKDFAVYEKKFEEYEKVNQQIKNKSTKDKFLESVDNLLSSIELPTGLGTLGLRAAEFYGGTKIIKGAGIIYSKLPKFITTSADIGFTGLSGYNTYEKLTNPNADYSDVAIDVAGAGLGGYGLSKQLYEFTELKFLAKAKNVNYDEFIAKQVSPFTRQRATLLLKDEEGRYIFGETKSGQAISIGGGIEKGQTPRKAALTELYQETGLKLKDIDNLLYKGKVVTPEETFEVFTANLKPGRFSKIKPSSDISKIKLINPESALKIKGQTFKNPIEKNIYRITDPEEALLPFEKTRARIYDLSLINFAETGIKPDWLKVETELGDYFLGTQSRYNVPYSSQKKYLKENKLLLAHGTQNPSKFNTGLIDFDENFLLQERKVKTIIDEDNLRFFKIEAEKTARGTSKGLFLQPPIATKLDREIIKLEGYTGEGKVISRKNAIKLPLKIKDEAPGYLGLSYAGFGESLPEMDLGITFRKPKSTFFILKEGTKEGMISPTLKTLTGAESELIINPETYLKATGNARRINIANKKVYFQQLEIIKDSESAEFVKKQLNILRTGNKESKIKALSNLDEITGIDYSSEINARKRYVDPIKELGKVMRSSKEDFSDIESYSAPKKSSRSITISELTRRDVSRSKGRNSSRKSRMSDYSDDLSFVDNLEKSFAPSKSSKANKIRSPRSPGSYNPKIPYPDIPTYPSRKKSFLSGKKRGRKKEKDFDFGYIEDVAISQDFTAKILGLKPKRIKGRKDFFRELERMPELGIRRGVIID